MRFSDIAIWVINLVFLLGILDVASMLVNLIADLIMDFIDWLHGN